MAAVEQPPWEPPKAPSNVDLPPLKIWNSLTRSKNAFVPIKAEQKEVSWYVCGPTVYDDAHLGHARNYVTTDILRRILRDYFGYTKLKFVMNITDIDDKIILRGRQHHLLAEFKQKNSTSKALPLETSEAALKAYGKKNLPLIPEATAAADIDLAVKKHYENILKGGSLEAGPPGDKEAKIKMHINTVISAAKATVDLQGDKLTLAQFYDKAQDVLLPYLDSLHGSSINSEDYSIFTKLTQKYEQRFMEDARNLNCLDPDVLTRVTEYVPQIVKFIQKIESNNFAYATSDGSVYFDITAFEAGNNFYARLEPWNRNDKELQADGEGSLTKGTSEKKSEADFALWKASKAGEPSWDSPWGKGRPGWHIECSVMASDVLGSRIDIHSGGIDLAFPHHDNELAQSEAYWLDKTQGHPHTWINYFMHMGHLSIQGSKMSKSLKNFTTIRNALAQGAWTPRSLRIVFLYGGWKEGMEVTDDVVAQGASWEEKLNNFFIQVNDFLRHRQDSSIDASSSSGDDAMKKALDEATAKTHSALCDSFNTRDVMIVISELASAFFTADKSQLSGDVLRLTAHWVTRMVRIFGLDNIGPEDNPTKIGWSGVDISDAAKDYVYALSSTRDAIRRKARSADGITPQDLQAISVDHAPIAGSDEKNPFATVARDFNHELAALGGEATHKASHDEKAGADGKIAKGEKSNKDLAKDVLALCDRLRDTDLFDLGVYLEDREGDQPAMVRPVSKDLLQARREKNEREAEKLRRKEEADAKAREQLEKGRMNPVDMFKTQEAKKEYSEWDEDGVPTKDNEGKDVAKSKTKKLRKDWERQKKLHETWLKTQNGA